MDYITEYIEKGSRSMTPRSVESFRKLLPDIQFKMTSIDAPKYPHLMSQIEFLTRFVEDFADGVWKESSFVAYAESLFALSYLLKEVDVIPDSLPDIGFSDDSAIIRAVLSRAESEFQRYAQASNIDWTLITTDP